MVRASVDYDSVWLHGFTPSSSVALDIGGFVTQLPVDEGGNGAIHRSTHGQDVVAGMTIVANDGTTTKTLVVASVSIGAVDVDLDVVGGTAPAGAEVEVSVVDSGQQHLGVLTTTADGSGNWAANFAGTVDLQQNGMTVAATTYDADGDASTANRQLNAAVVGASLSFDNVFVSSYDSGTVTFTIRSAPGGSLLASGSKPADASGHAVFNRFQDHQVDLVPGMHVTASDGTHTKGVTLVAIKITGVNPGTNVVTGTAPADAVVDVSVSVPPALNAGKQVTADAAGHWSADFTGLFDVTTATSASASVREADGDSTSYDKPAPTIQGSLDGDAVSAFQFEPNGSVTFTIFSGPGGTILASGTKPTDSGGSAMFGRPQDHQVDLVPGMHLTVSDGVVTKGLTLSTLAILSLDPPTDVVAGITVSDAVVGIGLSNGPGQPGAGTQVTADAGGHWSADFTGLFDITYSTVAGASVRDPDGDSTTTGRLASRVNASLSYDTVRAAGFDPGAGIQFRILNGPGGAVLAAATKQADASGSAWFNRYQDHGIDLVPGLEVTASDGTTEKRLTLASLTIVVVDPVGDAVIGTAPPDAALRVNVNDPVLGGSGTQVTAGPGGDWAVDFTGTFDLTFSSWAEVSLGDEDGDSTDHAKSPPVIRASLTWDHVDANYFAPGANVDFQILASPGGNPIAGGTKQADAEGYVSFQRNVDHGVDISPGREVVVSDGTTTKRVTAAPLAIVSVDAANDVISGTAPPGAKVEVGVGVGGWGPSIEVTADGAGNWSADFTGQLDVTPTTGASATVRDAERDATTVDRRPANIAASLTWDGIDAAGFAPGENLTLTIRESSGGAVLGQSTKPADETGSTGFERWNDHDVDLAPGMHVTVTDGDRTKELTLAGLAILSVDTATDTVAGTAPPNATVEVDVGHDQGGDHRTVSADANGDWTADFAPFDITPVTNASASVGDEDGDWTGVERQFARIDAWLTWDNIGANGLTPDADVTLTIRESPGGAVLAQVTRRADGSGGAWFERWNDFDVDLVPGVQVTVTDGALTKELTLADLAVVFVDPATETVSGTAPPGAVVEVNVGNEQGGDHRTTTANGNGDWSADFAPFDVTPRTDAYASVADEDGDTTGAAKPFARVDASLTWDNIALDGFRPGATVEIAILESPGGRVLATASRVVEGSGSAWFNRWEDYEVDLAPGMQVTADDGTNAKELTLVALAVGSVDVDTDVVSGTAPGGADVQVDVNDPEGGSGMLAAAAGNGVWSVDFSEAFDITFATWVSARVADEEGDTTSFDKPPARLDVSVTWDGISVEGFVPGASVDFTIRESPGGVVLASGSAVADGAGAAWFNRYEGFDVDLAPGMEVTADDGTNVKQLTLAGIAVGSLVPETDLVTGTAPAGATVSVNLWDEGGEHFGEAEADGSGDWAIDVSPFDITFNGGADARVADEDGDTTSASKGAPRLSVDLTYDEISAEGLADGGTVTLTIRQSPGGTVLATDTAQADGTGSVWFGRPGDHDVDLAPGMHVTVTDGASTKSLTLAALTIDAVDAATDTASGTAPPNTDLFVSLGQYGPGVTARSDGSGHWSADLGELDVFPGLEIRAAVADAEWDWTSVERRAPTISGDLALDAVSGCGFEPDSQVTVTIGDFSGQFVTVGDGCFAADPGDHGKDLVPGMTVSVTDGTITRTLTLTTLSMTVDAAAGHVEGATLPGAQVEVGYGVVDEERGDGKVVTADGSGHWAADFVDSPSPNVEYTATVRDPDGDATQVSWYGDLYLGSGTYTVDEDAGSVQITVLRYGTSHAEIAVSYATEDVTASAGSDYTAASGTLTFPDGVASRTFTVAITDDAVDEPNETVTIELTDPRAGAALGAVPAATLTIVDDDLPDTDPPETTILSGPSGPTNDATPTYAFSADEPGSTFECRIDAGAFVACTSPHTTAALSDGAHTFQVRATDLAGNTDPTPASRSFTVDTRSPVATVDSGPSGVTTDTTPTFTFSSDEPGSTFACSVDAGAAAACTSPHTTAALVDGAHTFRVWATDAAGNESAPASRAFVVDTGPPDTTIVSGPTGLTNDATPTFAFTSEPGATFQCRVDGAAFSACTSPFTTAALADGAHTFEVRATDAAGNTDVTPASRSFTVDATAPETAIVSGPAGLTNDATPTFAFTSEAGATFQCRVDSAAFAVCTSPFTTAALLDGAQTFEVRATDAAGNTDVTPASRSFTVDATAPETTIDSGPAGIIADPKPTFAFSSEPGAGFQCRIDGASFAACASPYTAAALSDGPHTFEVRAVDAAGNADPTPAARAFTVDTGLPETTIVSGPSGSTTDTTPTFEFSSEPGATFQCRIDGASFAACTSPYTTPALALGAHTFEVRAIDAAGNVDPTPASRAFTIAAPVPPKATLSIVSKSVAVTRGRYVAIRLKCGPGAACRGTLTLQATVDARLLGLKGARRTLTLGKRAVYVPAGRTVTVKVRLTTRNFNVLMRAKRIQARAKVTYQQPFTTATVTRTITLTAPKPAR